MKRHLLLCVLSLGFALAAEAQAAVTDPLVAAYQREFVFLDNEIRLLKDRKNEVDRDGKARVAASQKSLDELEAQLLELNSQVVRKNEDLKVAEAEGQRTQDSFDLAKTIVSQGNSRLVAAGFPLWKDTPAGKTPPASEAQKVQAELGHVFGQSIEMLTKVASIRTEAGSYFLTDGRKVDGQVTQVGRVAAFGWSELGGGTLAPAGKDILRVVRPETAAEVKQIVAGETVAVLPIYLYQGLDKNVDIPVEKTLLQAIDEGGPVAYIILLVGLIGFVIAGLRWWTVSRVGRSDPSVLALVRKKVEDQDLDGALVASQTLPGGMGRMMVVTVEALRKNPEFVEDAIHAQALDEHPRIDKYRSLITVFVGAAPMLGLLGTVSGMIRVFDVITVLGTSDPKLVSGGISEALITTALGLSVAIPLLLVGTLLTTWAERLAGRLEIEALRLVNLFEETQAAAQQVEA